MTDSTESQRETQATVQREARAAVPSDTFALRLVIARHFAGRLSIEQAARTCGISPGNWAHWEDGRRPRDQVEVAQAISEGLEVSFDWLLLGGPLESARGRPTKRSAATAERGDAQGKAGDVSNVAVSPDDLSAWPTGDVGYRRGSAPTVRPPAGGPKVRTDPSRPKSPSVVGRRAAPLW